MFKCYSLLLLLATGLAAAERTFDFGSVRAGETPPGFRAAITGRGAPSEWKVVMDDVPAVLAPFSKRSPEIPKRPVLAQLSRDTNDARAALFIMDGEPMRDFTLSTRFKIVSGSVDQMAGLAFRLQDDRNYYYVRADVMEGTVAFLRYVEGELIGPVSRPAPIKRGEWHTLAVECRGSKFRTLLDEKEILPWTEPSYVPFPDGTSKGVFSSGRIAFWTKADTVAHFSEGRLSYTLRERFAQRLVRETMAANPRLLGVKIFAARDGEKTPRVLASSDGKELGEAGGKVELDCLVKGGTYFGKNKERALVTMPLHDRNGETVGVVTVAMTTFVGQTEKNGLVRAQPIVKEIESRIHSARELLE
jgi:hypothetical protein